MDSLKKLIREIPDFPKPGILFYDITTLLGDKDGFHEMVDKLCEHYNGRRWIKWRESKRADLFLGRRWRTG